MFANKSVLVQTVVSLFVGQCIFWLIFLNYDKLPPEVPMWFLQPWGVQQLAARELLWLFPGLAIGVLAVNLLLVVYLYRRQPFLVNIVMSTSTFGSIFILMITVNILNKVLGWV